MWTSLSNIQRNTSAYIFYKKNGNFLSVLIIVDPVFLELELSIVVLAGWNAGNCLSIVCRIKVVPLRSVYCLKGFPLRGLARSPLWALRLSLVDQQPGSAAGQVLEGDPGLIEIGTQELVKERNAFRVGPFQLEGSNFRARYLHSCRNL